MPISPIFLDWSRPALPVAVDYMVERFGSPDSLDLKDVVVVVPGARAGRRLLEILVERAEEQKQPLWPPRIVTLGWLPEMLYETRKPFAEELIQQLAWVEALRETEPERLEHFMSTLPADDDLAAWLALGEMLGRLHRELAAEAMDFSTVVDCGSRIDDFHEDLRWQTLSEIQKRYLATLDSLDLWDRQTARLFAIRKGECRGEAPIVLVGTVDMSRAMKLMLDQVADRVTALVFAPDEADDRFDQYGCLLPKAWQDVEIPVPTDRIEVVDNPADQAAAVVRAIGSLEGRYSPEEITVGVPDVRIVPHVQQHLRQCEVPVRYGVGRPAAESAPYRLLEAVAEYLSGQSFSAFAALLRHPAIHQWLADEGICGDWLTEMDRYYAEHLPPRLGDNWLGKPEDCNTLRQVHQAIQNLLRELHGDRQTLGRWGRPLVELLVRIFGRRTLDPSVPSDRTVLAACGQIHGLVDQHLALPDRLAPTVSAADAIRLVLRGLAGAAIAAPPDRTAVELLGWLELPLDDAPALIVTGMNEGIVPASVNADLFMPNRLRRELAIEDNDRRYARDAYALSVLAASRRELQLIAGRRSADGDPLVPSRLLFACERQTAARRAVRFFGLEDSAAQPVAQPVALPGVLRPGQQRSQLDVPRPKPLARPVSSMRVTEFRDYLACPYRYYLRHQLGLEALSDAAEELDGGRFGSLAHEVLGRFGGGPVAGSTDAEQIRSYLDESLDRCVLRDFGKAPTAAIRVQVEQLRARLRRFAQWQADRAAEGWRIEHVETGPGEGRSAIVVDGRPMGLRGRIDRIDVQEATGRRVVFDYKTSDTAKTPEKAHRDRGEWTDLQLPLYRHLLAGMEIEGPVELGYIVLPKDTDKVDYLPAEWTDDELLEADRVAAEVVRQVRAEEFWPPAENPPLFAEHLAAICQDEQFAGPPVTDDPQEGDST